MSVNGNGAAKSSASSLVIVGARKFVFHPKAQTSNQICFWSPITPESNREESVPNSISTIFAKQGLARNEKLKQLASEKGARFVEFVDEEELISTVNSMLGIIVDGEQKFSRPISVTPWAAPVSGWGNPTEIEDLLGASKGPIVLNVKAVGDMPLESREIVDFPVEMMVPNPKQPRKYFNQAKIDSLAVCMRIVGQQVPVILLPIEGDPQRRKIFDGQRRWYAAQKIGKPTLRAIMADSISEAEFLKRSAVCNFGREGHQPMEIAHTLKAILDSENPKPTMRELAGMFSYDSEGWAISHLALLRTHADVQEALNPELDKSRRITFSVALEISRIKIEHQPKALAKILREKMSLSQVRHFVRHQTESVGSSGKGRKRKPFDDLRIFKTFMRRSETSIQQLNEMPNGRTVFDLFVNQPPLVAEKAAGQLQNLIDRLQKMKDEILEKSEAQKASVGV